MNLLNLSLWIDWFHLTYIHKNTTTAHDLSAEQASLQSKVDATFAVEAGNAELNREMTPSNGPNVNKKLDMENLVKDLFRELGRFNSEELEAANTLLSSLDLDL